MQEWTNPIHFEEGPIREEFMPEKSPTRAEIHVVFVPEQSERSSVVDLAMHDRNGATDPSIHRNWIADRERKREEQQREEQQEVTQRWQQWSHMRSIPKSRTGI